MFDFETVIIGAGVIGWTALPSNSLLPAYAGIRPKLYSDNSTEPNFEIFAPERTGLKNLFALHGIESPGLTSSLSLALEIANNIEKQH